MTVMKNNDYLDELKEMAGLDDDGEVIEENNEEMILEEETVEPLNLDGSLEYSIQLKAGDMRHFLMHHTYTSLSGWFGVAISLAAVVMLIVGRERYGSFEITTLIIMALLFTVIQPLQLVLKANRQIKRQPMFASPLKYNICKDGIVIRQDKQIVNVVWMEIRKVVETRKAVFVYTSPVRAFIFPKDQIKDFAEFRKRIKEKTGR